MCRFIKKIMTYFLQRLIRTVKTEKFRQNNKYVFDVNIHLNKPQIKTVLKQQFNVDVVKINTHRCPLKKRGLRQQTSMRYKRAIVKLKSGQTLTLTENL